MTDLIDRLRDERDAMEDRIRELEASLTYANGKLAVANKALATPADQWGVKVWTTDGKDINWSVESRYALQGVISRLDLLFANVPPEVHAMHLGRTAGHTMAAAVAEKVGKSLYAALKPGAAIDWEKPR